LNLSEDELNHIINTCRLDGGFSVSYLSDSKGVDVFLASLKLAGYSEEKADILLKNAIKDTLITTNLS
jgi:hypothetical protein